MNVCFIVWNSFQRRVVSIDRFLKGKVYFFPPFFHSRLYRVIDYFWNSIKTFFVLCREKPSQVWVQLPSVPLLYVIFLYKLIALQKVEIVADCHNSMLRDFWLNWPFCKKLLCQCSVVLVHNEEIVAFAVSLGIHPVNIRVLEDPPSAVACDATDVVSYSHPWILFPSSFSPDEPIQQVIEAAKAEPEITFVFTGNPNRRSDVSFLNSKPSNVVFTGYVPLGEFELMLCSTDAVLGLTTQEGVQLSVCNEAIGVGKPMILSDTAILRKLFNKGSIFVQTLDPESIANGCRECLCNLQKLGDEIVSLRKEREVRWKEQFNSIFSELS